MSITEKKVRYAVVGLGWFAQQAILPAFENAADNSELAALITSDPVKARELSQHYQVPAVSYEDFEKVIDDEGVDAVYLALPNSRHREFTQRAACVGVHVLCEKPMAGNSADCQAMIAVCKRHHVKLMIAYRLHFEESNLNAIEVLSSGRIGEPRIFNSSFTQQVAEGNTRLDAGLEGGPLLDVGIYCINASRYLFRAEPTEVSAFAVHGSDPRFKEVPESVTVMMRFPGERLACFTCGFGHAKVSRYEVIGTKGLLEMESAYTFHGMIRQSITLDGEVERRLFRKRDQIAPEILHFSDCIRLDREPEPSGKEGLIDVRIIEALNASVKQGRAIRMTELPAEREEERPTLKQEKHLPPVSAPPLVRAAAPQPK